MTHDELRKLCEAAAKAKDFAPHGLSADVSALHRAAETHMLALLDELELVYAVMENLEKGGVIDLFPYAKILRVFKEWSVWNSKEKRWEEETHPTFQAALARAWELQGGK